VFDRSSSHSGGEEHEIADNGHAAPFNPSTEIVLLIAEVVREGQESGELDRNISPATVKRAIFGALDELALGWLLGDRRAALKKTAAEVAEWLVRGLLPADGGTS